MKTTLLFLGSFVAATLLNATVLSAPTTAQLIVYNGNVGLVHEQRELTLDQGVQEIIYEDVAATLDTDSVSVTLPKGVTLYSQQYRFDQLNSHKLALAHLGKEVQFYIHSGSDLIYKKGVLLSASNEAVIKTKNSGIYTVATSALIFSSIPSTLITKPSLIWNVNAPKAQKNLLEVDYLISNITWKSNYVLNLKQKTADLSGWISIDNRSGKAFKEVQLHVLAGDLNRVHQPTQPHRYYEKTMAVMADTPNVKEVSSEGYHHYTIPFKVTLENNEKTQIKFIDLQAIPIKRTFKVFTANPLYYKGTLKHDIQRFVEIKSLDIPLPQGIVRAYAPSEHTTLFVGESHINHTPKHEKIALLLGNDFDLKLKESTIEVNDNKYFYDRTIKYTLTNRSKTAKMITLDIPFITTENLNVSVKTDQKYHRKDSGNLVFDIAVKADSTQSFKVEYRVKI